MKKRSIAFTTFVEGMSTRQVWKGNAYLTKENKWYLVFKHYGDECIQGVFLKEEHMQENHPEFSECDFYYEEPIDLLSLEGSPSSIIGPIPESEESKLI